MPNIVQSYGPTSERDDDEVEEFYDDLDRAVDQCKNHEVTIVMGDLNAKVGGGGGNHGTIWFGREERKRGDLGKVEHREATDGDECMAQTAPTKIVDMEITWRQSTKSNRLCDHKQKTQKCGNISEDISVSRL